MPDTHGSDGLEGITFAKDVRTLFVWPDVRHEHVQLFEPGLVESLRETCRRKSAGAAETEGIAVVGNAGWTLCAGGACQSRAPAPRTASERA